MANQPASSGVDASVPAPESSVAVEDLRVPSCPRPSRRGQATHIASGDEGSLSIACDVSDEYLQHFLYAFNVEGGEQSNQRVVDALRGVTERQGVEVRTQCMRSTLPFHVCCVDRSLVKSCPLADLRPSHS